MINVFRLKNTHMEEIFKNNRGVFIIDIARELSNLDFFFSGPSCLELPTNDDYASHDPCDIGHFFK